MPRAALAFLILALVSGLLAFDLIGDYSVEGARPVCLGSLAVAAGLTLADAFGRRGRAPAPS